MSQAPTTSIPVPERETPRAYLSEADWQKRLEKIAANPAMRHDNVHLPEGATNKLSGLLLIIGAAAIVVTILGAFAVNKYHALAAFEVGLFTCVAMSLGALFLTMVFHSLNAGWTSTVRRQFENVASILPVCWVMVLAVVLIELLGGGILLTWLSDENAGDYLLGKKTPFLNPVFFGARFVIYGLVWLVLSQLMFRVSRKQDETGNRSLTRVLRFNSGWGLLAFALTTAFFAFDFLMALDFRFFSTMWGVYYFASCTLASVSVVVLVLAVLKGTGRLTGAVTEEHFHDLGKLVLSFTVFWSYIAFSQYFLIWYSNIPEETAWFVYRTGEGGYKTLFLVLAFGHFVFPFCILLFRKVKRTTGLLAFMAAYMIAMTVADMIWIIRPMVYVGERAAENPGWNAVWLDAAGIIGALCIWGFFLVRAVGASPLVPLKDPTLHEALAHKNYV
jgi:hypothetical protein